MRYQPEKPLLDWRIIGGRSRCPHCRRTLRAAELIPLISFIAQKGRCRSCGIRLSLQYPLVEALGGIVFVLIPLRLSALYPFAPDAIIFLLSFLWIAAFLMLLLIALVDFYHYVIPDQLNGALAFLGITLIAAKLFFLDYDGAFYGSFMHNYVMLFFPAPSVIINHVLGVFTAAMFFAALIYATKGAGMGWGDFKLAAAIGALFGWPDVILAVIFAFLSGGLASIPLLALGKKDMKGVLPFGPFLAIGVAELFFGGREIIESYLVVMGLYPVI